MKQTNDTSDPVEQRMAALSEWEDPGDLDDIDNGPDGSGDDEDDGENL